jgi:hypothetical protein
VPIVYKIDGKVVTSAPCPAPGASVTVTATVEDGSNCTYPGTDFPVTCEPAASAGGGGWLACGA